MLKCMAIFRDFPYDQCILWVSSNNLVKLNPDLTLSLTSTGSFLEGQWDPLFQENLGGFKFIPSLNLTFSHLKSWMVGIRSLVWLFWGQVRPIFSGLLLWVSGRVFFWPADTVIPVTQGGAEPTWSLRVCCLLPNHPNHTWRIIPFSKWLITMVSKSPNWGDSPSKWAKWFVNGGY